MPIADQADHPLALEWRKGNVAAGEELIRRHGGRWWCDLDGRRLEPMREDLFQAIVLELIESLPRYRGPNFSGFARTIVRRVRDRALARTYQVQERISRVSSDLTNAPVTDVDLDVQIEQQERAERLRAAMASLSLMDRETLTTRHLQGMGVKDIARKAGVPVSTARTRLHRAHKRLAKQLKSSA